jgi:hypothetical protein
MEIAQLPAHVFTPLFTGVVTPLVILVALLLVDLRLGLVALVSLPLLALVMLAMVPLTKQMASSRFRTVATARLLVAWRRSSETAMPVSVAKKVAGSQKQKSETRTKSVPLSSDLSVARVGQKNKRPKIQTRHAVHLRDTSDGNSVDHGPGNILGRIGHLLCHVHDDIETDEGQSRLEQTEKPGHAVRPTGLVVELGEDEVGAGLLCHGEQHHADDDDASDRPIHFSNDKIH